MLCDCEREGAGSGWASEPGYTRRARTRIVSSFTKPRRGFSTSCRRRERLCAIPIKLREKKLWNESWKVSWLEALRNSEQILNRLTYSPAKETAVSPVSGVTGVVVPKVWEKYHNHVLQVFAGWMVARA